MLFSGGDKVEFNGFQNNGILLIIVVKDISASLVYSGHFTFSYLSADLSVTAVLFLFFLSVVAI